MKPRDAERRERARKGRTGGGLVRDHRGRARGEAGRAHEAPLEEGGAGAGIGCEASTSEARPGRRMDAWCHEENRRYFGIYFRASDGRARDAPRPRLPGSPRRSSGTRACRRSGAFDRAGARGTTRSCLRWRGKRDGIVETIDRVVVELNAGERDAREETTTGREGTHRRW